MNSEPTNHHRSNDHVHHLSPLQIKPPPLSSSASFSVSFNTPTSSSSSSFSTPNATPTSAAQRRIAIAVDLSDESAFAVKWAVENYLRSGDAVILLHVRTTSILYGADWGSTTPTSTQTPPPSPSTAAPITATPNPHDQKLEEDFDNLTNIKAANLAQPLVEAQVPYKIHIVKDHDLKERLCLEVERLGLSAVIMGSRGFGASRRNGKGRLGSVSDYCVNHCVCPVVVVRYTEEKLEGKDSGSSKVNKKVVVGVDLHPVPEEEQEFHDADEDDIQSKAKISVF